jgi:hypothetical protein
MIEVPYDTQRGGGVASAVVVAFTGQAVHIPETASRTFRSVALEVFCRDSVTVATSITAWMIGVQIDAVGASDETRSGTGATLTNSGEHYSFIAMRDANSANYFTTNFTGSSHTVVARMSVTGPSTNHQGAKLYITYEFDDASATTRVKTVRIPCDGHTTTLTLTLQNIGSATEIPALDTFLPENTKTFRQIFAEFEVYDANNGTANFNLNTRIDAGTTTTWATETQNLNTAQSFKLWWDLQAYGMATNATHALQASASTTARYTTLGFVLIVTYTYNHSASTTIINSLNIALVEEPGFMGFSAVGDVSRAQRDVFIEEPATVTMVQSGYLIRYTAAGTVNSVLTKAGAQASYRTYTHNQGVVNVGTGQWVIYKRIDSGGVNGAALTLARGRNTFNIDFYSTNATAPASNTSGNLILNYTSGKHASGDAVHNHTVAQMTHSHPVQNAQHSYEGAAAFTIPEASYYLVGISAFLLANNGGQDSAIAISAELLAGEGAAEGWETIYASAIDKVVERGIGWNYARARTAFRRWPGDPDTERMDVETARKWRVEIPGPASVTNLASTQVSMMLLITYHAITYTWSGTITNSSGGNVDISVYRAGNGERIGSTSRTGNGAYALPWYDDTELLFAEARESATLIGRSDNGLAA